MRAISKAMKESCDRKMDELGARVLWDMQKLFKNKRYVAVECLYDGEISYKRFDTIRKGVFNCDSCRILTYFDKLSLNNKVDIKLLSVGTSTVSVQCKTCDHIFNVQSSHLSTFICQSCKLNRFKNALKEKNCEYLYSYTGPPPGNPSFIVYKNEYNDVRRVQTGALMNGRWSSTGYRNDTEDVHLYLFRFENEDDNRIPIGVYSKIGISKHPEIRLRDLRISFNTSIEILKTFKSRRKCLEFETKIHRILKEYNVDKKIAAKFTNGIVRNKKRNVERHDGVTEWFLFDNDEEMRVKLNEAIL